MVYKTRSELRSSRIGEKNVQRRKGPSRSWFWRYFVVNMLLPFFIVTVDEYDNRTCAFSKTNLSPRANWFVTVPRDSRKVSICVGWTRKMIRCKLKCKLTRPSAANSRFGTSFDLSFNGTFWKMICVSSLGIVCGFPESQFFGHRTKVSRWGNFKNLFPEIPARAIMAHISEMKKSIACYDVLIKGLFLGPKIPIFCFFSSTFCLTSHSTRIFLCWIFNPLFPR